MKNAAKEVSVLSSSSSPVSPTGPDRGGRAAKGHKRVFGTVEAVFDGVYLLSSVVIGIVLLYTGASPEATLGGAMALLLAAGDAFHLLPRMCAILTGEEDRWARAMGVGKFVTSITMTVFYLLLWHLGLLIFAAGTGGWGRLTGLVYLLAGVRIALCFPPQNRWLDRRQPVSWGIYRNVPFLLLGGLTASLFAAHMGAVPAVDGMWVAIALSFLFYLPVVLWAGRKPMIGMLMLPKTVMYLWMLIMCLYL